MGLHFQNASLNDIISVTDKDTSMLRSIYIFIGRDKK